MYFSFKNYTIKVLSRHSLAFYSTGGFPGRYSGKLRSLIEQDRVDMLITPKLVLVGVKCPSSG